MSRANGRASDEKAFLERHFTDAQHRLLTDFWVEVRFIVDRKLSENGLIEWDMVENEVLAIFDEIEVQLCEDEKRKIDAGIA